MTQKRDTPRIPRPFMCGGFVVAGLLFLLSIALIAPAHAEDKINFADAIAQGMSQGSASQKYHQALVLMNGRGRAHDQQKALSLLEQAAGQGYAPAEIMMGALYINPHGMSLIPDDVKAVGWLQKAYAHKPNDPALLYYLGIMYGDGRGGLKKDTQKQLAFYKASATADFPPAMHNLGTLYLQGNGIIKKDIQKALDWYKKAAKGGMNESRFNLGFLYLTGDDVPQDYKEAAKWLNLAAGEDFPPAQYWLGVLCRDGHGVPQDNKKAAQWFEKAAQSNLVLAQWSLGLLYERGEGVPKNAEKAYFWKSLSASYGNNGFLTKLSLIALRFKLTRAQVATVETQITEWRAEHPSIFGQ